MRKYVSLVLGEPSLVLCCQANSIVVCAIEVSGYVVTFGSIRVGRQSTLRGVRLDQPDLTTSEVIEQRFDGHTGDFPRPHNLGVVDISAIVNPFAVNVVFGRIAHNDEVVAGRDFKLRGDPSSVRHLRVDSSRQMNRT